ncbi:apoptosis-enhancing nuclease isoform X3 [Nothobranchius furzeri]|uniref:Transcript variant X2 n=2 Tax=Nothobranchius furzeri TaxID=105023 RepID=A0A9D2YNA1_NOTFU|nr:uncharacterized protein isg20 isoform X3 [Nothobranchius furzeri]KAF7223966.1 transcript variant X2 [Nothobranchius furzeri]
MGLRRICSHLCTRAADEGIKEQQLHHVIMAEVSNRNKKASSTGLLNNYRYLYKKSIRINAMENEMFRKKPQQKVLVPKRKTKRSGTWDESLNMNTSIKKAKISDTLNSENKSVDVTKHEDSSVFDQDSLISALRDQWEVDSGFSSETSPPPSGRSSPCLSSCSTSVVALDCEMVGTGPGGRCNELARCSILNYHGNVLYDKYIKPCQPVTDFRTRWSGIQRHHLQNATPFYQAREEAGRKGHCSVEDAQAALDLYKLVEGEWEQELQRKLRDDEAPCEPSFASSNHYMQDEYWPEEVVTESQ